MKQTINLSEFRDAFHNMGRGSHFSYKGLEALYNYIEDMYGEDHELDVIAFCCEFTEYENFEAYQSDYPDIQDIEELEDHTSIIYIDDRSFIIQDF